MGDKKGSCHGHVAGCQKAELVLFYIFYILFKSDQITFSLTFWISIVELKIVGLNSKEKKKPGHRSVRFLSTPGPKA